MDDIAKISVPDQALRIEIDDPHDRSITQPAGLIRGWFATRDLEIPETFSFQLAGITLPHSIIKREDVESALPGHTIVGFKVHYELQDYLPYIQQNRLAIRLILDGYDSFLLRFTVKDSALAICLAAASS